jgi:murein DD-endopeptidase MepM/ murein hydrolase activator NlpD
MDPTVVSRPKVNITPKITKIGNLAQSAEEIRKTSSRLRKTFEKGTYQKKTQLSVLNRYKKRLESIQKQNDKKFTKKQRVKIKLPEIKKFAGSFFTPGGGANDPLKSIGALAAFNALRKGAKGDVLGAIGPALVAAGIFFGPSLLKGGVNSIKRSLGYSSGTSGARAIIPPTGNRTVFGGITSRLGRVGSPTGTPGIRSNIGLTARQFQAGAFMQTPGARAAFPVALPGTPSTAEKLGGAAQNVANRFGARGGAVAAGSATSRAGGSIAAKAGGVGARAIPLLGTAFNIGLSAYRFSQGDAVGGILSALSAIPIVGWAALGVDLAREFGAFDGTILGRRGQDRLKQQTEKQKALVERKGEGGTLTFGKTLNRYERVVNKFEEFAKNFKGAMGMGGEQTGVIETGNRAVPTGIELQDLEATGGESPGAPDSPYGPRRGRMHQGNDYFKPVGTPISVVQPGTVTVADMNYDPTGWGAVVEIRHPDGSLSRYAHLSKINVAPGSEVVPGQVIGLTGGAAGAPGSGNSEGPHLHFEYENASGRVDPTSVAPKIFRFGGNVRVKQSGQQSSRLSSEAQQIQQTGTYTVAGVTYDVKTGAPVTSTPQISRSPRPARGIQYYPSYDSRGQMDQVIPYPVVQQQQMSQGQSSSSMIMSGPSEQELLNSFYKRVLLNTVA